MSDYSEDIYIARTAFTQEVSFVSAKLTAPHVLMRPKVYRDGDAWCALYGENIAIGVCGFGGTPEEAVAAFDKEWRQGQ